MENITEIKKGWYKIDGIKMSEVAECVRDYFDRYMPILFPDKRLRVCMNPVDAVNFCSLINSKLFKVPFSKSMLIECDIIKTDDIKDYEIYIFIPQ